MEQSNPSVLINLITTEARFKELIMQCIIDTQQPKPDHTETVSSEELLTIKQIATFFQVSNTTIHNWKNAGLLPYVRIKSRIRFKKSEVLKLYEKRRIQR